MDEKNCSFEVFSLDSNIPDNVKYIYNQKTYAASILDTYYTLLFCIEQKS